MKYYLAHIMVMGHPNINVEHFTRLVNAPTKVSAREAVAATYIEKYKGEKRTIAVDLTETIIGQ